MQAPQPEPSNASSPEQGFTIVETLVALFVFALAGVALMSMQTQSSSALSRVESRSLANLVAQNNLIDQLARRTPVELGVRSGETELAGRRWQWSVEIARTDDPSTLRLISTAADPGSGAADASVTAYVVAGDQ